MTTVPPITRLASLAPGEPGRPLRLLRFAAVRARTGLSRSTIWRLERRGSFPRHRRISANAVAWVEEEVHNWIRAKVGPLQEIEPAMSEEGVTRLRRTRAARPGGHHVPSRKGPRSTSDAR
jgi:prophage regulatory protein